MSIFSWLLPDVPHICGISNHLYVPRYDEAPLPHPSHIDGNFTAEQFREMLVVRTYVYDVCLRCGSVVKR